MQGEDDRTGCGMRSVCAGCQKEEPRRRLCERSNVTSSSGCALSVARRNEAGLGRISSSIDSTSALPHPLIPPTAPPYPSLSTMSPSKETKAFPPVDRQLIVFDFDWSVQLLFLMSPFLPLALTDIIPGLLRIKTQTDGSWKSLRPSSARK